MDSQTLEIKSPGAVTPRLNELQNVELSASVLREGNGRTRIRVRLERCALRGTSSIIGANAGSFGRRCRGPHPSNQRCDPPFSEDVPAGARCGGVSVACPHRSDRDDHDLAANPDPPNSLHRTVRSGSCAVGLQNLREAKEQYYPEQDARVAGPPMVVPSPRFKGMHRSGQSRGTLCGGQCCL
jgi:hypothetical protein